VTREELEHAIRAACDVVGDLEVSVFGSQRELVDYIDGALGEDMIRLNRAIVVFLASDRDLARPLAESPLAR